MVWNDTDTWLSVLIITIVLAIIFTGITIIMTGFAFIPFAFIITAIVAFLYGEDMVAFYPTICFIILSFITSGLVIYQATSILSILIASLQLCFVVAIIFSGTAILVIDKLEERRIARQT